MPQSVILTISEEDQYYCSLMSTATNNCSVSVSDDSVKIRNVSINLTGVLDYGAMHKVNMSVVTVNDVESSSFTFNLSKIITQFWPNFVIHYSDTHHVISATVLSVNDGTVCLECSFRHNSPSTSCYAAFLPITTKKRATVFYYKITKSLPYAEERVSDCIDTLPNGVYQVSALDVLSYEEGSFNNTAFVIPSLITINANNSISTVTSVFSTTNNDKILMLSTTMMMTTLLNGKFVCMHVCLINSNIISDLFPIIRG